MGLTDKKTEFCFFFKSTFDSSLRHLNIKKPALVKPLRENFHNKN